MVPTLSAKRLAICCETAATVDPLEDLVGFSAHETALTHVIQGGDVVVDRS